MIIKSDFPEEKGLGLGFGCYCVLLIGQFLKPKAQLQAAMVAEPVRFKSHVHFRYVSMAFTWPASVSLCLLLYSFIHSLTTLNEVSLLLSSLT